MQFSRHLNSSLELRLNAANASQPAQNTQSLFPTTRWTELLQPIGGRTDTAHAALEKLMEIYRVPIIKFVSTLIYDRQQAEDIAHDFIARLLERGDLENADRTKGRFRAYLTTSIRHFVASHYAAQAAGKRGGPHPAVPLDSLTSEPSHAEHGERVFVQQWWRATLDEAHRILRAEWEAAGKADLFDDLAPLLWDKRDGQSQEVLAARHRMSAGTIGSRKHRLARRYSEIIKALIRATVNSNAEAEEEIRFFLGNC